MYAFGKCFIQSNCKIYVISTCNRWESNLQQHKQIQFNSIYISYECLWKKNKGSNPGQRSINKKHFNTNTTVLPIITIIRLSLAFMWTLDMNTHLVISLSPSVWCTAQALFWLWASAATRQNERVFRQSVIIFPKTLWCLSLAQDRFL